MSTQQEQQPSNSKEPDKKKKDVSNLYYDPVNDTYKVIGEDFNTVKYNYEKDDSTDSESRAAPSVETASSTPKKPAHGGLLERRRIRILEEAIADADMEAQEAGNQPQHHDSITTTKTVLSMTLGGIMIAGALIGQIGVLGSWLMAFGTLLLGFPLFVQGFKSLLDIELNEYSLLTLAVLGSMMLAVLGLNPMVAMLQAAGVTILFRVGSMVQGMILAKSQSSVDEILSPKDRTAVVLNDEGEWSHVPVQAVEVGTIVKVKPGGVFPIDCEIVTGSGSIDRSLLTGQTEPLWATSGTNVSAGAVSIDGAFRCRTITDHESSMRSRIGRLLRTSVAQKGSGEKLLEIAARIYTPTVLVLGLLVAVIPTIAGVGTFDQWAGRSLVLLAAACPYALIISLPLTYFSGTAAAVRKGIIIKGSHYLEVLASADCAAFSKTGVLTKGNPIVSEMIFATGFSRETSLQFSVAVEKNSTHPLGEAIVKYAGVVDPLPVLDYTEALGMGVSASIAGKTVLCGSHRFLTENEIDTSTLSTCGVCLAIDGSVACGYSFTDFPRDEAVLAVMELRALGIKEVSLLTGDSPRSAYLTAEVLGLSSYYAELTPADKAAALGTMRQQHKATIFVGDADTDGALMAVADVGIAINDGLGPDAEAANVVIIRKDLTAISDAVTIARMTMNRLKFNATLAITSKLVLLLLAIVGLAPLWAAVLSDVVVSIVTMLNASSLLKKTETADAKPQVS